MDLDGYREGGGTSLGLEFTPARQTLDVLVAGTSIGYGARTSWSRVSPVVRIEYRHRFASRFTQTIAYVDAPETTYELLRDGESSDFMTVAAGVAAGIGRLTVGAEYGTSATTFDTFSGHTLRGMARIAF